MATQQQQVDLTANAAALAARHGASTQEMQTWIEQGYAASDIDWAYRIGATSRIAPADLFALRSQGMNWEQIWLQIQTQQRNAHTLHEQDEGRKLVPGGARRTSRYFYGDEGNLLDEHYQRRAQHSQPHD